MSQIQQLEKALKQGRISRREFLTRAAVLGFGAAVGPHLLAATARATAPKSGGRLKLGVNGAHTTDSLDPATTSNQMPMIMTWQLRNNLVEIDHLSNPIPELAESWEASPQADRWVFKLRRGIEFHNGKTMRAEDVVFSINHHRSKQSKSVAKSLLTPVKMIKADGPYTVIFELEGGYADFPYILSDFHLVIVPEGTQDKEFEKGIGTGGYILQDYEPGVRALVRRNPHYWKSGRAHFDEVETIGIMDISARTNAMMNGQIDVMNQCDLRTVHLLEKKPGINIVEAKGPGHFTLPMRTDRAPFNDNNVRLAFKYAIDRKSMLQTILRNYGMVGNDHPISPSYRFYADLPQRAYDPEKAKFLMKKAGRLDHTFNLHAADAAYRGAVDMAVLYKEQAGKAGININVVREPDDGYWSNVWMKKDFCIAFWLGRQTVDWMFSLGYAADSSWNESFWRHESFNQLLAEARKELNEAKRREMYTEMQQIVSDEGGAVIPLFASYVYAARKSLAHGHIAANYELDGYRLAERWWFEN